jgi:hypothetical protein
MPNMNNIKIGKTLRQTRHSRLVRYNITWVFYRVPNSLRGSIFHIIKCFTSKILISIKTIQIESCNSMLEKMKTIITCLMSQAVRLSYLSSTFISWLIRWGHGWLQCRLSSSKLASPNHLYWRNQSIVPDVWLVPRTSLGRASRHKLGLVRYIYTHICLLGTISIVRKTPEGRRGPLRTRNLSSSLRRSLRRSASKLRPLGHR